MSVEDCDGIPGAIADPCGTYDTNPANDGMWDCAGVRGGVAAEDMCGACDDDAENDCIQDCAGV